MEAPEEYRDEVGYGTVTFYAHEMQNIPSWPPIPAEQLEERGYHPIAEAIVLPEFLPGTTTEIHGWIFVYETPGEPGVGWIALKKRVPGGSVVGAIIA